jgi:hypothetical protein
MTRVLTVMGQQGVYPWQVEITRQYNQEKKGNFGYNETKDRMEWLLRYLVDTVAWLEARV